MRQRAHSLYSATYHDVRRALQRGDEVELHALCAAAATRNGIESTLLLLAMSDAETGRRHRTKQQLNGVIWRDHEMVRSAAQPAGQEAARAAA